MESKSALISSQCGISRTTGIQKHNADHETESKACSTLTAKQRKKISYSLLFLNCCKVKSNLLFLPLTVSSNIQSFEVTGTAGRGAQSTNSKKYWSKPVTSQSCYHVDDYTLANCLTLYGELFCS